MRHLKHGQLLQEASVTKCFGKREARCTKSTRKQRGTNVRTGANTALNAPNTTVEKQAEKDTSTVQSQWVRPRPLENNAKQVARDSHNTKRTFDRGFQFDCYCADFPQVISITDVVNWTSWIWLKAKFRATLTAEEGEDVGLQGEDEEESAEAGGAEQRVEAPQAYVQVLRRHRQRQRCRKRRCTRASHHTLSQVVGFCARNPSHKSFDQIVRVAAKVWHKTLGVQKNAMCAELGHCMGLPFFSHHERDVRVTVSWRSQWKIELPTGMVWLTAVHKWEPWNSMQCTDWTRVMNGRTNHVSRCFWWENNCLLSASLVWTRAQEWKPTEKLCWIPPLEDLDFRCAVWLRKCTRELCGANGTAYQISMAATTQHSPVKTLTSSPSTQCTAMMGDATAMPPSMSAPTSRRSLPYTCASPVNSGRNTCNSASRLRTARCVQPRSFCGVNETPPMDKLLDISVLYFDNQSQHWNFVSRYQLDNSSRSVLTLCHSRSVCSNVWLNKGGFPGSIGKWALLKGDEFCMAAMNMNAATLKGRLKAGRLNLPNTYPRPEARYTLKQGRGSVKRSNFTASATCSFRSKLYCPHLFLSLWPRFCWSGQHSEEFVLSHTKPLQRISAQRGTILSGLSGSNAILLFLNHPFWTLHPYVCEYSIFWWNEVHYCKVCNRYVYPVTWILETAMMSQLHFMDNREPYSNNIRLILWGPWLLSPQKIFCQGLSTGEFWGWSAWVVPAWQVTVGSKHKNKDLERAHLSEARVTHWLTPKAKQQISAFVGQEESPLGLITLLCV